MKITDAQNLLKKYVSQPSLLRHCQTVAVAMAYFAEKYGEDAEYWEGVGLLHDVDFEKYPDEHCKKCAEIFREEKANFDGITDELIHSVQSHAYQICSDVEPNCQMEKVLYTVDQLSGFIVACAAVRPSKSVMDMEVKSVMKKFKTKDFAAACDRDVIRNGCQMLGVDLNDFVGDCIAALRKRHEEIGV